MELARQILLALERGERGNMLQVPGYERNQIQHHMWLLGQAGLVEARTTTIEHAHLPRAVASSMTWAGHDFLDAARNDETWRQAIQKAKSTAVPMTFDLLKQLLVAIAETELAKHGMAL